jgi:hypothetical protein
MLEAASADNVLQPCTHTQQQQQQRQESEGPSLCDMLMEYAPIQQLRLAMPVHVRSCQKPAAFKWPAGNPPQHSHNIMLPQSLQGVIVAIRTQPTDCARVQMQQ